MKQIFHIYLLILLSLAASVSAFADQPSSALDDKPSVDTAAGAGAQTPAASTDTTAADTHTSYLYDLKKLIEKSRENIKEVNEKIKEQAVLKRNQKREERAREYYEKGLELTSEGKLDEARDYFEKAIRITEHPEMAGYIKESQRRLQKQEAALTAQEREHYNQIKADENTRKEDVETAYKQAVDLYKQKKYHPAQDAFEHVNEIAPDYRATDSYLKIIDQDIILADAVAAKQQAAEIQRQQKEAEAARAKEKAMWLAQIEEKEKERKESIDKQAEEVYDEAIELYKNKKFAEAKKKFEEVSWVIPDYKATMKYLGRIDRDAQLEQEHAVQEQQKALQEQRWEEEVEKRKQEAQHQKELAAKEHQQEVDNEEQAQFLYTAAVSLYDQKKMPEAFEKFNEIEKLSPDFKDTRRYLDQLNKYAPARVVVAAPVTPVVAAPVTPVAAAPVPPSAEAMPQQVKLAISLEDQQKQVQDIAVLVDRSEKLYRQIADMADDRSTAQMRKRMAEVEEILNNLKQDQERILRQMREEQWKRQQEELKARQQEFGAQAEKMYQDGLNYLRSRDYTDAKIKFLELENTVPDYKATRRYLARIDKYQKNANVEAVTNYEKNQAEHLKELQDKENAAQQLREEQEQEKQHNLELQQQASLMELVDKASGIYEDIVTLSRQHDYEGMKVKFTDLENVVTSFMTLKMAMMDQKDRQEREKQLARESMEHRNAVIREEQQEDRQIHANNGQGAFREGPPSLSNQPADVDIFKRREIMQEQNMLFSEAVNRYEHKKYTQAKLLFGELADQNDRRAEVWLKKVDRAITRELLNSQEGEERERTAFIEDQLKAQRELNIIQERERQRQKKLTEELERQKRLYEDDQVLQLQKEETMKAQVLERQRQEEKRLKLEKEREKEQEKFRFHKIEEIAPPSKGVIAGSEATNQSSNSNAVAPSQAVIVGQAQQSSSSTKAQPAVPSGLTPAQIQAQVDFSNQRKAYLDRKYEQEQKEQARQEKIKAQAEAKAERAKERAEKLAQEKKHREEFLVQQAQEREEKIQQEKIVREETKRREELERQERQRQAQLEAQREAVRRQLEDGVEAMYREALDLYKQGNYTAAADKFKDVQDILPGYKNSEQYMDDARQKSYSVDPQNVVTPAASEGTSNEPASPSVEPAPVAPASVATTPAPAASTTSKTSTTTAAPASPSESHQDDVSKALDLFDPNAK